MTELTSSHTRPLLRQKNLIAGILIAIVLSMSFIIAFSSIASFLVSILVMTIGMLSVWIIWLFLGKREVDLELSRLVQLTTDLSPAVQPSFFDRRLHEIANHIYSQSDYMASVSKKIDQLGKGDFEVQFGGVQENGGNLGYALDDLRKQLKVSAIKEAKTKWELTEKAKLSSILEEEHSSHSLSAAIGQWLKAALEVQYLSVWTLNSIDEEPRVYELMYWDGYGEKEAEVKHYDSNDGFIVELNKSSQPKMLFNKSIHASCLFRQETVSTKGRCHFMRLPLLLNKQLYAFIELGNNKRFGPEQMKFPKVIAEKMCIGFMRIKSAEHAGYLLNESQMLAEELMQREENLQVLNQSIQKQHSKVAESINYARHVQEAIIPSQENLRKAFPNSFMLNQPRDKVSGDFLWMQEGEGSNLIAVADCTGHGVPGAMLSMMGYFLLENIASEFPHEHPALLLNKLDDYLTQMLGGNSNFGNQISIDLILCRLYHDEPKIEVASAYRPLYIHDGQELIEVKGDRKTIGGGKAHIKAKMAKSFTPHTFTLQPSSCLYMFSDGYVDQFGGPKNLKMGSARLKKFVEGQYDHSMLVQEKYLKEFFQSWRGGQMQIDDMIFVGIKI